MEHYLMMVGAEIRRTRVKNPLDVDLRDMLVDFKYEDPFIVEQEEPEPHTQEELKQYSDWLKQAFLARWKTKPPEQHEQ